MKKTFIFLLFAHLFSTVSMAQVSRAALNADIDANIYTNSTHKITGDILNDILKEQSNSCWNTITDGSPIVYANTPLSIATGTISIANAAADGTTKGAATFTAADFNATTGLISIDYTNGQAATGSVKGFLTAADWTTFNSKQNALTAGTGISISTNTITNTAPNQTVTITGAGTTTVSGTYPTYTVTGAPSGITVGTTTISSGTSGAIPFNNAGVYGEDATKLFWKNADDFLGIGTALPTARLHAVGTGTTLGTYAVKIDNASGDPLFHIRDNDIFFFGDGYSATNGANPKLSLSSSGTGYGIGVSSDAYSQLDYVVPSGSAYAHAFYFGSTAGVRFLGNGFSGFNNVIPTAVIHAVGTGATPATYWLKGDNSAGTPMLYGRDDGKIEAGLASGALTIGLSAAFDGTLNNTFVGYATGTGLTSGTGNTAFGQNAGHVTSGSSNSSFGKDAGKAITDGVQNTAIGESALALVTGGDYNTAIGSNALSTTTGDGNTAVGRYSLLNLSTTSQNTAIGYGSGQSSTSAQANIFIGYEAGYYNTTQDNQLFIDNQSRSNYTQNQTQGLVYGIFAAATADQYFTVNGNVTANGRMRQTQGADVASVAGAIALGYDGNTFEITGTNAITLISNLGWQNGAEVTFVFTSTATLTDGTANSGTDIGMELAGNANFVASADDVLTLVLCEIGGTQRWREKSRSVN